MQKVEPALLDYLILLTYVLFVSASGSP